MSPSSPPTAQAGFSMLETMVAFAILAAVIGVAAASWRGPSPKLQLDAVVASVQRAASEARYRAVQSNQVVEVSFVHCDGPQTVIRFFADGTATASDICIEEAGLRRKLRISPMTGRLIRDDPQ